LLISWKKYLRPTFNSKRSYDLPELQGIATAQNIDLKVKERTLVEGWAGKPKGLLQVLWGTGWINPDVALKEYIKAGKPGCDFEHNGDLKANVALKCCETPHGVIPRFQARTFGPPTSCDQNIWQE
jgi:hypothetical protein